MQYNTSAFFCYCYICCQNQKKKTTTELAFPRIFANGICYEPGHSDDEKKIKEIWSVQQKMKEEQRFPTKYVFFLLAATTSQHLSDAKWTQTQTFKFVYILHFSRAPHAPAPTQTKISKYLFRHWFSYSSLCFFFPIHFTSWETIMRKVKPDGHGRTSYDEQSTGSLENETKSKKWVNTVTMCA